MNITLDSGLVGYLNPYTILTGLTISAVKTVGGNRVELTASQVSIENGILCITINDMYALTESDDNRWTVDIYGQFNYTEDQIHIARVTLLSGINSSDVTYLGDNVFYLYLGYDIHCDINVGGATASHIIDPWNAENHGGLSKSAIGSYVGNEKNVNLHKQLL